MQDYRKYTIPTDIHGKVFPMNISGKVFPMDLGGKSFPIGNLRKIKTFFDVAIRNGSCLTSFLHNYINKVDYSTVQFYAVCAINYKTIYTVLSVTHRLCKKYKCSVVKPCCLPEVCHVTVISGVFCRNNLLFLHCGKAVLCKNIHRVHVCMLK